MAGEYGVGNAGLWMAQPGCTFMPAAAFNLIVAPPKLTFSPHRAMAPATLKNQLTIIANEREILANQRKILKNQEQLTEHTMSQRKIIRNQEAIIKNQKKIMANQRRGAR
jgi:hypothetical protein